MIWNKKTTLFFYYVNHNKRMNDTDAYSCYCNTDPIYTVLSILGFVIPLLISEILPLSNCEANCICDGILKLIKKNNTVTNK